MANLYQKIKGMTEEEIKPTENRTEALLLLTVALLKKLNAKGVITNDDIQEVFESAVDNADDEVADLLDDLYGMLTDDADVDDDEIEDAGDT
ncbi:MAG TPA: hypothetical protein VF708_16940 [Pyrinomonadaceae bacterium]|jgi:hypothetical protein